MLKHTIVSSVCLAYPFHNNFSGSPNFPILSINQFRLLVTPTKLGSQLTKPQPGTITQHIEIWKIRKLTFVH